MNDPILGLTLFVAGSGHNSLIAQQNLAPLLNGELASLSIPLQVVDVLKDPGQALAAGILMTPALCITRKHHAVTLVGNLSRTHELRLALGLPPTASMQPGQASPT